MVQSIKELLLSVIIGLCAVHVSAQNIRITPTPNSVVEREGHFTQSEKTVIVTNLTKVQREQIFTAQFSTLPLHKWSNKPPKKNYISILLLPQEVLCDIPQEAYQLQVTPKSITLTSATMEGLYYAYQSLLQLGEVTEKGIVYPCCEITDAPRFPYRGIMLDISRHFLPIDFIKKQIDVLATWKINRLHLHLTDAAGWRIEIKKYPELTQKAAFRTESDWNKWWLQKDRRYVDTGSGAGYGGYYTQDELKELVAYAEKHHITIIPEIEMPGHSEEVLYALPHLSCAQRPYVNSDFCMGRDSTFTFLEDVLTEVMAIFPSEYIHIGGDEASKEGWKTCPKCQERMKAEGLTHIDQLQSYGIKRMEQFLYNKGRKLLGWDEILEGGLAPRATVMSWRGEEGGIKALTEGHHAIMTPGNYCYFDSYQDAPHAHPFAFGPYLPLQKVYNYDPMPQTLPQDKQHLLLGIQGNLWTEFINTPEEAEFMLYPRALAIAEIGWTMPENKSWESFYLRALEITNAMRQKGYQAFDLSHAVGDRTESKEPTVHLAVGKSVYYRTPYHEKYNAGGNTALTDGKGGNWTFTDGRWQGFIDGGKIDVIIDLGNVQPIQNISAHFLQMITAEVYLPASVTIGVATKDTTEFRTVYQEAFPERPDAPATIQLYTWKGREEARFIRFQATLPHKPGGWLFTDEIIVR